MPKKRITKLQFCKLCSHDKYTCPVYGKPTAYCVLVKK